MADNACPNSSLLATTWRYRAADPPNLPRRWLVTRSRVPQLPDFGRAQYVNRVRDEVICRELVVRSRVILHVTHHLGVGHATGDLVADSVAVAERVVVREVVMPPH